MTVRTTSQINQLDPLLQALEAAQTQRNFFAQARDTTQTVIIGVSGGADSICLLHGLWSLAAAWRLNLHVAHLDHNLRPESSEDAQFVQAMADELGLPCTIETVAVGALQTKGGIEDAARRARYEFLGRLAVNVTSAEQVPLIAVGHNADDQAETVLMNFIRGSGLDGLGGMGWITHLPVPIDRPVQVVRPLLDTRRAEIVAYLARHNVRWREDGTNSDKKFLRNRLRHDVLPLLKEINPNLLETLGRNAEILRTEAERINQIDAEMLAQISRQDEARIVLDLEALQACELPTMRNILRLALYDLCKEPRDIRFAIVDSLVQVVQSSVSDGRSTVGASGPHPLVADICWTLLPANGQEKATLSLHQSERLPRPVDHPLIDDGWPDAPHEIGVKGTLASQGDWLLKSRTMARAKMPDDWRQHDPWGVYLDADSVDRPQLSSLEYLAASLRFAPLGMNGQHKSIGDFFTDRKIAPAVRAKWPLVVEAESGRVLWVCGLQPAHDARITKTTEQVLHLWWERK